MGASQALRASARGLTLPGIVADTERMPASPIAFDLTRLITRLRHASPTGIDRVDLAYARHYLGGSGQRFGLVTTAVGPRIVDGETARGIVERVAAGWIEDLSAEDDPVYRRLLARLSGAQPEPAGATRSRAPRFDAMRRRRLQLDTSLRAIRSGGVAQLPANTLYLHTSHLRLDKPARFDWLYARPDIRAAFFVHDLIPISHPEYGRPGEASRHAVRMQTIARHADHVLCNSQDVADRFAAYAAEQGFGRKPVTAAWLGAEPVFGAKEGQAPRFARPVFLICGTIESRKNHLLLLNLWRSLAESRPEVMPRLVIVGRRGWEAESVFDMLDRCPAMRDHVVEARGLSTQGLARLLRAATALLMPSFIEGYGLPVIEAAASGLPVLASDIPVHREIAGAFAQFLDPLDGPGWRDAILALCEPESRLGAELAGRLEGYAPPDWAGHFERVDAALAPLLAR